MNKNTYCVYNTNIIILLSLSSDTGRANLGSMQVIIRQKFIVLYNKQSLNLQLYLNGKNVYMNSYGQDIFILM